MEHIPFWVIILFFVLLTAGIKRCFARVVSVRRMIVMPLVMLYLSLHGANALLDFTPSQILCIFLGLLAGLCAGHAQARNVEILADRDRQLIKIPGSPAFLVNLMAIFLVEFVIHYAVEAHLFFAQWASFKYATAIACGLCAGFGIGRNATYFGKYLKVNVTHQLNAE